MLEALRARLKRIGGVAEGAAFAASVLNRTGVLGSLTAGGVMQFALETRGVTPGPHLALMLHARNKPEKLALVAGNRRYKYAELDHEMNRLANGLVGIGVPPRGKVALMMPNCAEYVIAQSALRRIGATAVQIPYRLKAAEIAYILDNAQADAVIVHHSYLAQMEPARRTAGGPEDGRVIVVGASEGDALGMRHRYEDLIAKQDAHHPPTQGREDGGGGVIIYTSGTTGKPKGASRDYKETGLEAVADFMAKLGMSHDDRHLVVCPLYHSAAPAFSAMTYTLGGSVVVIDHFDPERVLETIATHRITSSFMVPTMLVRLCQLDERVIAKYDTSSLRWVASGAAPLATETARRFQETFGKLLWNFYGSTETGMVTLAGPDDHTAHPGTVGRLLRSTEARLLDEAGNEVPVGQVGELYVRNNMLITGYHRNEQATNESLRDGFFSVGDLARTDPDGYYYLESRKHDMVISGGVNIYPREIEDHLHTHPDIIEAAVIGVPDDEWGETLKAYVVARNGSSLTEQEITEFCRDSLADYKRPRYIEFLDELPHNPTGKVLKRELRAR
jgi:fatty-acyl-CoA synthase